MLKVVRCWCFVRGWEQSELFWSAIAAAIAENERNLRLRNLGLEITISDDALSSHLVLHVEQAEAFGRRYDFNL